jgi:Type IV secretion system pilin
VKLRNKIQISIFAIVLVNVLCLQYAFAQTATTTPCTTSTTSNAILGTSDCYNSASVITPYSGPEASVKKFLCTPSQGADTTLAGSDLTNCVNKIYRFGAVLGSFAAVFFIVIAGYQYMISGEKGKESGKKRIISAIVGLVIIFTSYIILKQINPSILQFKTLQPPQLSGVQPLPDCATVGLNQNCTIGGGSVGTGNGSGGISTGGGAAGSAHPEGDCRTHTCTDLRVTAKIPCNNNCKVEDPLAKGLTNLWANYKGWHIGEAFPPTIKHQNPCHVTGACADIGLGTASADAYDKLCAAIKQYGQGIGIYNESSYTTANCGASHHTKYSTGEHLHVFIP